MARSLTSRSTNPKIMDDNIKILDAAIAAASTPPAEDVSYDNTDSGLTATDTQAAIDELVLKTIKIDDVTETTDASGKIALSSSVADTGTFISAIPLNQGSVYIRVCKRYNSEDSTTIWLLFENATGEALASTSIKFRVFHI